MGAAPWIQSVLPSEIVRQRRLGWPDFHPEDFCHICGRRNPCWTAPACDWEVVHRDSHAGIYCPSCWAELYQAAVGTDRVLWTFSMDFTNYPHRCHPDRPGSNDLSTDTLSPAARQALVRMLSNEQRSILTHRTALHNSTREALIRRGLVAAIHPAHLLLTDDGRVAAHSLGVEG